MTRHATIHNVRRVKTSSDHYALLADFRFHGYRLAGTPVATVAIWNAGDAWRMTHRDLDELAQAGAQIILGCELRNRWTGNTSVQNWCAARGWKVYRGDRTVTSHETAILMAPAISRYDGFTRKTANPGFINGGAGPDHDTARYSLRVRAQLPRVRLRRRVRANFVVIHLVPSWTWARDHDGDAVRKGRAYQQVIGANTQMVDLRLPTVIGGDWNGEAATVARQLGLRASKAGPRVATKGRWAPDWFATRAGRS